MSPHGPLTPDVRHLAWGVKRHGMADDVSDAGRWRLSFGVGHETADVISSMSLERLHSAGVISAGLRNDCI